MKNLKLISGILLILLCFASMIYFIVDFNKIPDGTFTSWGFWWRTLVLILFIGCFSVSMFIRPFVTNSPKQKRLQLIADILIAPYVIMFVGLMLFGLVYFIWLEPFLVLGTIAFIVLIFTGIYLISDSISK